MPGIHLVASGWLGASISCAYDCHVFLVDDGNDAFLVDAGCGLETERLLANIDRTGVPRTRIRRILLTHAHADHAAGASWLGTELGAEIWASRETAAVVEAGDEVASGLKNARRDGIYPDAVRFEPARVGRVLGDEFFEAAGRSVESISTPGHADGHLCFVTDADDRRVAFVGDLVFARGRVAVLETPDCDVRQMHSSIATIRERRPNVLLAGHGSLILDNALDHIDAALDAFSSGALPPSLVGGS